MADPWEQSQTVDVEVRAYVTSLVNAVGGTSTVGEYYDVGDDAPAVLNDILRWLRLYDEKLGRLDVKRVLAEANLVRGDLLEILALWSEEVADNKLKAKLALACLQLLTPLTWPVELEEEKSTVNHHRHLPYLQLAQVSYKRAILHHEHASILRTIVRIALPSMVQLRRERSRRDESIIRVALYLFRNVTMITQPQMLPSQGDENEISRSSTISGFAEQDVFNLLLTIGSGANDEFQEQDVVLLETLFHLLKGVDGRKLFMEQEQVQHEESEELRNLMIKEKAMHKGYNKHAPSRHHRFGTMIWVKRDDLRVSTVSGQQSITDESTTLHQMDSSKKWNKPKYRGKVNLETTESSDFNARCELTEQARKQLKAFVEDFLDSSFNPLFASLRKAIDREADRVQDMHRKQYFYIIHWFLSAESARREQKQRELRANAPLVEELQESKFAYIAAVLDQETFVILNRNMQRAFDEKNWQLLQATLLCFTQILLTTQAMAESEDEEDQEIAENIQNRIFYEEATHDRIVAVLRGYSTQGFAYLDTVTECVHVFVRMLERYSKQNVDLQVRSKRRARKKQRKQGDAPRDANEDAADEAEDEREAQVAVTERKFDFARFSAKFLSQPCVDTFLALLRYYAELNPAQLKRCHRYLYRLAFKHELAVYLFRVDILALLHKLIKGPQGLSPETEGFKDWEQLVQQIFRRCIKWMSKDTEGEGWKEMCMVEMLFTKIPNTVFYLQNGYERVVEKRPPRAPAELEFKASVEDERKVPVAVSVLLEQGKGDALDWVKKELERAVEERQAWMDAENTKSATEPAREDDERPEADAVTTAPSTFISADNDERKSQLFKDKHLRLLLTTLGLQRLGAAEDTDASWVVRSELELEKLKEGLKGIRDTEFDPPSFEEGQTAVDMIRNKSASTSRHATEGTFDDDLEEDGSGSGGDIDENMFPPNLREKRKANDADGPAKRRRLTKRNRKELTEDEVNERAAERKRKETERNAKIKSALYITASDDESNADADEEFFREEAATRKKTEEAIKAELVKDAERRMRGLKTDKGKKKKNAKDKAGKKSKRRAALSESEEEDDAMDVDDPTPAARRQTDANISEHDDSASEKESPVPKPRRPRTNPFEEESSEEEPDDEPNSGTPSTSPAAHEDATSTSPLKELSVNTGLEKTASAEKIAASEEEEDEVPVTKPAARRNVRAGFVIDYSDSE
ncbi:timeless-domain-containing protein [Hortaea werneckii]|nr:timeless-domain-containing protein [Hortaea werneckii]